MVVIVSLELAEMVGPLGRARRRRTSKPLSIDWQTVLPVPQPAIDFAVD